jgi:hypothetical protein
LITKQGHLRYYLITKQVQNQGCGVLENCNWLTEI